MPVTRKTLYEQIWAEPMTGIASRYGVSSSYLSRVCERLNVPRPGRGHWAKIKAGGETGIRPELPAPEPGDDVIWVKAGEPMSTIPIVTPTAPAASTTRRPRRNVDRTKAHSLVFRSETLFENALMTDEGYLRPRKQIMLDVYVSRPALSYALDVANQLYQLLEADGHRVVLAAGLSSVDLDEREERTKRDSYRVTWRPSRPTVVYVGTVAIGLTVFETSESVNAEYVWASDRKSTDHARYKRTTKPPPVHGGLVSTGSKHDMPSGRLAVRASSPYHVAKWERVWRETKPGDLTTRLSSIAVEIAKAAPELAIEIEEGNRRYAEEQRKLEAQHREWQREEMERQARAARKQSRDSLLQLIDEWTLSMNLESFFRDIEARIETLDDEPRAAMRDRIDNARALLTTTNALEVFQTWKAPQAY